ncbi:MAG: hypothetical protein ABFR36_05865 [Acidobacteriota bacterium]
MENKVENVGDFFIDKENDLSIEDKWDKLFDSWLDKVDKEKQMLKLFELKLWLESTEEFISSSYFESIIFKFQQLGNRNYNTYLTTFSKILSKIMELLKDLDFKKDRHLINFEEFIVEKTLEKSSKKRFPSLRDVTEPESWFFSLRTFLSNIKILANELSKVDMITQRTFFSFTKLYHKELLMNPIIISLLNGKFIPKMDKIYQKDISDIISEIRDKKLKKNTGILYILAFRTLKINNFIELNLKKNRDISITTPLILALKKNIDSVQDFYKRHMKSSLATPKWTTKDLKNLDKAFLAMSQEYKKVFETEFKNVFEKDPEKISKRDMLRNIVNISDNAIHELIENVSKMFNSGFECSSIFENYVSRNQKAAGLKKKLVNLHTKINDHFENSDKITENDIFFELNHFIETDLNYLLYKDWNEFLKHYDTLEKSDFSSDFKLNLKDFHLYLTKILEEIVDNKK